jgi:hypothetical protein
VIETLGIYMARIPPETISEGSGVFPSYIISWGCEGMKNDKFYSELNKFMNKGHKRGSGHLYDPTNEERKRRRKELR